jgi:hypothetical protein
MNGHGFDLQLPREESTRPDVFFLSHAASYSAWYQVSD